MGTRWPGFLPSPRIKRIGRALLFMMFPLPPVNCHDVSARRLQIKCHLSWQRRPPD